MSSYQPHTVPTGILEQGKDTYKLNGVKTALPFQDVVDAMKPRQDNSDLTETARLSNILASSRVRPTDTVDEDPACLIIQKDGKDSIVGTMGNLSTVAGRAKAKKTFAVSFAVAAAVASTLILNRIKGQLPAGKHVVLFFDTEQSRHHVLRVIKRICRLCGIDDPPNLVIYSLRPYSPQDRLKAIDYAVNNTPNLGLVVIDGVRDLAVDPVLDAEQASQIMTHLLQWTDRLNIHIMCVLHQNKSDTNLRGHIGTELVNKSETVISVTRDSKDKEISHVEAEYCRNREFDPFSFSVDDSGLPHLVENGDFTSDRNVRGRFGKQGLKKPDLPTADSMTPETVTTILGRAFSHDAHLRYSQLLAAINEACEFLGTSLSKNRAEAFITRMLKGSYIVKFKPEKSRYEVYQLASNSETIQPS